MDKINTLFLLDKLLLDIGGFIVHILRLPQYLRSRSVIKKNMLMTRSSDDCYIIGLGPSLKNIDLSKINGDIIVTNRFNKVKNARYIKPKFYCMADGDFFNGDGVADFKEAIEMFPNTSFVLNAKYLKDIKNITSKTNNMYYVNSYFGTFHATSKNDFTKKIPVFFNVVGYAIALGMFLKYKRIVLLGCDFNSFASQKQVHCYSDNDKRKWKMYYELLNYSFASDMHDQLEAYSKRHGIDIINATEGSLIDAYKRDYSFAYSLMEHINQ